MCNMMIKNLLRTIYFSFVFLILYSCRNNQDIETIFPDERWVKADASEVGVDNNKLLRALDYLKDKSFEDGIEEVLVIRHGRIIYEGDSTMKSHNIYSCSKGFTSTVLGLLIDQGKLGLDDKASRYDSTLSELYPQVTFRHFATMTSGYSAEGRSRWNDENADWSYTPYKPEKPHFSPGTHFEYWDEAQMTFGKVLTQVINEPMKDFLKRELTDKIKMGEWNWRAEGEANGIPVNNGCTNVIVNAHQLARFGHLFLNRGNWDGKQLLSSEWCTMATTAQVSTDLPIYEGDRSHVKGSGSYGFNWWVNSPDGLSNMPDAPMGAAYLSGLNHNICFIIPEWNMVIIRMGDDKNPPEGKHVIWNEFIRLIGLSIK